MRPTRSPLRAAPLAALLLCACGPRALQPDWDQRPPNVLLVTIDTLRADHLGLYGYPRPTSPHLDALAERAAVFDEAHSSSSWTLPGLASMLTGEHASTHGCWSFSSTLGRAHETLPERLLARGYDTAACTASIFVDQGYGLQQGLVQRRDELLRDPAGDLEDSITSERISDFGVEFLEAKAAARAAEADPWPWFLWLHYADPHDAYLFHEGFSEPFVTPEADELQRQRDLYDGEIRFTDHHLGRVLDVLRATGLEAETIVVVSSDHGEEFGDHGARHHGHTLHRELTRVPLLFAGPGVEAGRRAEVVQMVDLVPTLLDLTGAPVPADGPGRSLRPLLAGGPASDAPAVQELRMMPHASYESIRAGRWTLIRPLRADAVPRLYDHEADPGETVDVAAEHPDVVARLVEQLEGSVRAAAQRADRFGGVDLRDLTPEQMDALRALGYVGRDEGAEASR